MSKIIRKTADIRNQNKKTILKYMLTNDLVTQKDLASKVNLSVATISNLTTQLIQDGILKISSYQDSEGGKRAGLLSAIEDGRYILAIQFSRKNTVDIQVMTLKKQVVQSLNEKVDPPYDADAVFRACERGVKKCEEIVPDLRAKNLGVGIALPGIIEKQTGILINSTLVELENQPIIKELQERLHYNVYAENESNLLALALSSDPDEFVEKKDIVYLHIDDGLGVGIICNGELLCGSHGLGGEINAVPLVFGQMHSGISLEQNLRISSFISAYEEQTNMENISFPEFVVATMDQNNDAAQRILSEKGYLLGQLIMILDSLFDPEAFYLGGKIALLFNRLYSYIMESFDKNSVIKKDKKLNLYLCKDYERLLEEGCADLVFDHWNLT